MKAIKFNKRNIESESNRALENQILPGLERGKVGFLLGKPAIGKTYFLLSLAYEIATGKNLLGVSDGTKHKVLYVAAEDGVAPIFSRSKAHLSQFTGTELKLLEQNLAMVELDAPIVSRTPNDPSTTQSLQNLIDLSMAYDLVIVDTIRKAMGSAREVEEDTLVDVALTKLTGAANCAVLCSHHLTKSQVSVTKHGVEIDSTGGSGLSVTQQTSKYHLFLSKNVEGGLSLIHSKDNYVPRDHRHYSAKTPLQLTLTKQQLMVAIGAEISSDETNEPVKNKPSTKLSKKAMERLKRPKSEDGFELVKATNSTQQTLTLFGTVDDDDL